MFAQTVTGPVDVSELGFTLPHEHVLFDTTCFVHDVDDPWKQEIAKQLVTLENCAELRREPLMSRDNAYFMDEDVAARELELFSRAGGRTIVDVSPPALGRNALALRRLAQRTGVNIVASTGHY